jgi:hypothetical protein
MPKKIISMGSNSNSSDIYSAPVNAAVADNLLVEGTFVALNSAGEIIIADYRNSSSKPAARGALIHSNQMKDFRGNVLDTMEQMSYTRRGKIGGYVGLIPGTSYFLSSGGNVQAATPGTTGDLRQYVGYAETPTILVIDIGPPSIAP